MQHEARKYLFDIVQAANDIQEFTHGLTSAEYIEDVKTQAAVERKFEIIGEALNRVRRLDRGLLAAIPLHERIIGFRNVISHGYDVVAPEIVWDIIQNHLPALKRVVEDLLDR